MGKLKEENANYKIMEEMTEKGKMFYYVYKKEGDVADEFYWKFVTLCSHNEEGLKEAKDAIKEDKMVKPEPKLIGFYK